MQGSAALPVRQQSLARREREQRSGAHRVGGSGMAGVRVEQEGLDHGDARVLGSGRGQHRAHPRPRTVGTDEQARDRRRAVGERGVLLATVAAEWSELDADRYPFVRRAAAHLRDHDDREQFIAGVDIFLAGVATLR